MKTITNTAGTASLPARYWLSVTALLLAGTAAAECVQTLHGDVYCGAGRCLIDKEGVVYCSRYYKGDARKTLHGKVLCGKGDCAKDRNGAVICSSKIGGTVFVDSKGYVHCYGKCEAATVNYCEALRADRADSDDSEGAKESQTD